MKKTIFYPVLFAVNPVLLLFSANVSDIPLSEIFPSIVITPLICGGLYWLLTGMVKNTHRAGLITLLIEIWFFHYGTVLQVLPSLKVGTTAISSHWFLLPMWSLLFALLGSSWIWKRVRRPDMITNFLNILSVVLVMFSAGRVALDVIPRYTQRPIKKELLRDLPESIPPSLPDIYFIVVDGYARQDILAELYQFDNQPFINELERRGFQVASRSKSNYMQTALSVASTLNMDYMNNINPALPDRGQLIGQISHSQVRAILEGYGYQIIAFSSGYLPTEISDADIYLASSTISQNYDLESLLAVNTIARPLFEIGWIDLPISKYRATQDRIQFIFQTLTSLPNIASPKFVFAHLLIPHPPFIFTEDGPITPDEYYILADGERLGASVGVYQKGYSAQLEYTNSQILSTVDAILAGSDQPPIIIIQADHGPGLLLNTGSAADTCHSERFSILSAIYLPVSQYREIPEDITAVNVFRLILNTYFEANLGYLSDRQYYSTWNRPYQFIDVSELTNTPCIAQ
jgi:hypothetical protein